MFNKMVCQRCGGRTFLDRIFSDNKNFETYCILCGDRKFVQKSSEFGQWLLTMERKRLAVDAL
jgi:hypothetical protein